MNKAGLHYPTYTACREAVKAWTPDEMRRRGRDYTQNARTLEGQASKTDVRQYHLDMARAIEDEMLAREYCAREDKGDPLFEADVREYQPGDMIDTSC